MRWFKLKNSGAEGHSSFLRLQDSKSVALFVLWYLIIRISSGPIDLEQ